MVAVEFTPKPLAPGDAAPSPRPCGAVPVRALFAGLLVALPWLNPFTSGPSPAVVSVGLACFCAVAYLAVWPRHGALALASGCVLAALLSSVMALCQLFGVSDQLEPWVSSSVHIAFANLRQRNQFASLTVIGIAGLFWLGNRCRPVLRARWARGGLAAAFALLLVGTAASASRTGAVEVGLMCLLTGVWWRSSQRAVRQMALWALPVYVLAALALPPLAGLSGPGWNAFSRFATGDDPCSSRFTLWSNVLHLIAEKPGLGWGWGELDYAHFVTLYPGARFCSILDNAHNLPLHLAVELGIPVALLVCGGFAWWVLRQRPWADSDATRQMAWSVLAVILLHSLLEYPLWYGPFQMVFGLSLVLLWRRAPRDDDAQSSSIAVNTPSHRLPVLRWSIAYALLAALGYAAWDYHRISQIYLPPEQRAADYRTDTLAKISPSWLFRSQVQFAELTTTPLTAANAAHTFGLASTMLHFSPEPVVVQKLIESAVMLHLDDEALYFLQRFKAAFPEEHKAWAGPLQPTAQ